MHGRDEKFIQNFSRKLEGKRLLRRPKLEGKRLLGRPKLEGKKLLRRPKLEGKRLLGRPKLEGKRLLRRPKLEGKRLLRRPKLEGKRLLGRPRHREYNIKIYLNYIGLALIRLIQCRIQLQAFVKTVMKLHVYDQLSDSGPYSYFK
jgi:hypothetical protein